MNLLDLIKNYKFITFSDVQASDITKDFLDEVDTHIASNSEKLSSPIHRLASPSLEERDISMNSALSYPSNQTSPLNDPLQTNDSASPVINDKFLFSEYDPIITSNDVDHLDLEHEGVMIHKVS